VPGQEGQTMQEITRRWNNSRVLNKVGIGWRRFWRAHLWFKFKCSTWR